MEDVDLVEQTQIISSDEVSTENVCQAIGNGYLLAQSIVFMSFI
jgi:hypothetical protein